MRDQSLVYSVSISKLLLRNPFGRKDCKHVSFGKFSCMMIFAARLPLIVYSWATRLTTLHITIPHVVSVRAKEQMPWVNACTVVATVENVEPIGNRAAVQRKTNAMSQGRLSINSYPTVAASIFDSRPIPTSILGFGKFSKEALFKRFQGEKLPQISPPLYTF